jgi:hypothetical protein
MSKELKSVTKNNPCPHCGKPDWCYSLGELTVCNRDHPPADGWYQTGKCDRDGHYFYALIENRERFKQENFRDLKSKKLRPAQTRTWEYPDKNNNPHLRVIRIDNGNGGKPRRWQEKWDGTKWVKGLRGVKRENILIYRYQELKKAIEDGATTIYVVEGETCADALWNLGLPATTNIGGSGKWKSSDTQYLIEIITNSELTLERQGAKGKGQRVNNIDETELSSVNKSTEIIANENSEPEHPHRKGEQKLVTQNSELCQAENLSSQNSESVNGINSKNNDNGLISSTHKEIYIEEDNYKYSLEDEGQDSELKNLEDNQNVENYPQDSEFKNLESNNHLPSQQSRLFNIVLCPDRDTPGVKHMDIIEKELLSNLELIIERQRARGEGQRVKSKTDDIQQTTESKIQDKKQGAEGTTLEIINQKLELQIESREIDTKNYGYEAVSSSQKTTINQQLEVKNEIKAELNSQSATQNLCQLETQVNELESDNSELNNLLPNGEYPSENRLPSAVCRLPSAL